MPRPNLYFVHRASRFFLSIHVLVRCCPASPSHRGIPPEKPAGTGIRAQRAVGTRAYPYCTERLRSLGIRKTLNAGLVGWRVREFRSMILESTAPRNAPLMWRFSDDAPEPAAEMRLITHAAPQRNGTKRLARRQHEVLGNFDAPAGQIIVCRDTERGFERTAEVTDAESKQGRQWLPEKAARDMAIVVLQLMKAARALTDEEDFPGRKTGLRELQALAVQYLQQRGRARAG
jgi:hypothetical protein